METDVAAVERLIPIVEVGVMAAAMLAAPDELWVCAVNTVGSLPLCLASL